MIDCMMETERLIIRRFDSDDFDALLAIMSKSEVMYAWEHGFSEDDVRNWMERQFVRYAEDGIGYFAVVLKEGGQLIGQAGKQSFHTGGREARCEAMRLLYSCLQRKRDADVYCRSRSELKD